MDYSKLCPKCGGALVSVGERTGGFSGTKAVVGAVVAGPIGVAAGALGKKLITMQCEKCGYTVETNEKDAQAAEVHGAVYAPVAQLQREMVEKQIQLERQLKVNAKNKGTIGNMTPDELEEMRGYAWVSYQNTKDTGIWKVFHEWVEEILACIGNVPVTMQDIKNMIPALDDKSITSLSFTSFFKFFGGTIEKVKVYTAETNKFGMEYENQTVAYRFADRAAYVAEEERKRYDAMSDAEKAEYDDARKKLREQQSAEWKNAGLCGHCGGQIGGMFGKKCKSCGQKA